MLECIIVWLTQYCWWYRRELPILHYQKIMVICPYPFLMVVTQLFSWIMCINYCICILTGSPGLYFYDHLCYTKNLVVMIIIQLSKRHINLTLPHLKQGNYLLVIIYGLGVDTFFRSVFDKHKRIFPDWSLVEQTITDLKILFGTWNHSNVSSNHSAFINFCVCW